MFLEPEGTTDMREVGIDHRPLEDRRTNRHSQAQLNKLEEELESAPQVDQRRDHIMRNMMSREAQAACGMIGGRRNVSPARFE
jgi:hypothetical protein